MKIPRKCLHLLFGIGMGISLHDFCHALYQVGGYREILGLQGGYFGFAIMIIAYVLLTIRGCRE